MLGTPWGLKAPGCSQRLFTSATQLGWVVTLACLLAGPRVPEFGCCYSA
jgi:hypothetical protein